MMQVDDKYQYGCESKDAPVHGWISADPPIGLWQIAASEEFRSGGPLKQILTSHVGPTTLTVSAPARAKLTSLPLSPMESISNQFDFISLFLRSLVIVEASV